MRWLDPASQARLKGLLISPRRAAGAGVPGRHRSPWRGHSRDFSSHRPYAPGDEARAIDWRAYARLDRFFVREYRAEDRIPVVILLDASGSMTYAGAGRPAKFDAARRVAAAAAWLALAQGDEAGVIALGGGAREVAAVRAGAAHMAVVDAALDALSAGSESDLAADLTAAAGLLPRRALCLLVSDLMGDSGAILKAAGALIARRHELRAARVIDPDERDFPFDGPCVFEGLEGGAPVYLDAREAAPAYRAAFARQAAAYASSLRRAGAPYAVIETGGAWEGELARLASA